MDEKDEVVLNEAVDRARNLGPDYKYRKELEKAEDLLYELCQCPVEPLDPTEEDDHQI